MTQLEKVFEKFTQAGLLAHINYWCCSSCGGYAITIEANDLIKSGAKKKEDIKGCVFFHNQDTEQAIRDGQVSLRYGDMNSTKYGVIGISSKECGDLITGILKQEHVPYDWDGDPDVVITASFNPKEFK